MMICLMELGGSKGQGPASFHIKIQSNLSTLRLLYGQYQKLYKGNESERRNLEQLKGQLDTLHLKMLMRDQEASQTLTDEEGSASKGGKSSSFFLFLLLFLSVSVALSTYLAIQTKEGKESALTNLCD